MKLEFTSKKQRMGYYKFELTKIKLIIEGLMENGIDHYIKGWVMVALKSLHSDLTEILK